MMLTAAQVATHLAISTRKVYELAASGQMACHRFGGAVRFSAEDVAAYVALSRHPVRPPPRRAVYTGPTKLQVSDPEGRSPLQVYFEARRRKPRAAPQR